MEGESHTRIESVKILTKSKGRNDVVGGFNAPNARFDGIVTAQTAETRYVVESQEKRNSIAQLSVEFASSKMSRSEGVVHRGFFFLEPARLVGCPPYR